MDKLNLIFKRSIPHLSALVLFLTISAVYFSPQLKGYLLRQSDIEQHIGMSKEISDFRKEYNSEPLWTNATFAGMPAYQISTKNTNIITTIKNWILKVIPRPIGYMFFLMLGFYILLLCFNVNSWLAIIGALAFGLSSLNLLFLATGHNAKVHAISFIPPLIGGVVYAYRKNLFTGSALVSVFTCLHLSANHFQMTYYLLFLLLGLVIVEFYRSSKEGVMISCVKRSAIILVAGLIGLLPVLSNILITNEYSKHTTRGESELTIDTGGQRDQEQDALNSDYIKEYSFGFGEIWSLVIPNAKGGANGMIGQHKDLMNEVRPEYKRAIAQQSTYWGEQNFSGGAFYFGASVFLLFVLGLFFLKDAIKWALLAVSVLAVMLSWKYGSLVDVFIEHFPLYNKFRDTKMMLILVQVSFPVLGFIFVNKLLNNNIDKKRFLYVSLGVTGLFLIFYMAPHVWFDFLSRAEENQINQQLAMYKNNPNALSQFREFKQELIDIRIAIFRKDVFRSLFFVISTGLVIYLYMLKKLKRNSFLIILGFIILVDFWAVGKRYLNNEKRGRQYIQWVKKGEYYNPYKATAADLAILERETTSSAELKTSIDQAVQNEIEGRRWSPEMLQKEKEKVMFRELNFATNYKVFSLQNPFANARTSYYHKSLGGYHGAKLKRYQEIIEFYLTGYYQSLIQLLKDEASNSQLQAFLKSSAPVLNMLNTKYVIYNTSAAPIKNPHAYGNAWFVKEINFVESADQEILALDKMDKKTAVVQVKFKDQIQQITEPDSTALITLTSYKPNHLVYNSLASGRHFAVFSEIFYDDGWNAYIDGVEVDYIKVNYLLRGLVVPEGEHQIEFKFEPKTYYKGRQISVAGSVLIVIFVLGTVLLSYRKQEGL